MAQDIARALNSCEIEGKIHRLCAHLDKQSVKCVSTIVARLRFASLLKNKKIHRLSKKEKRVLETLEKEFYPNIIAFENSYFYNGYFLPINHFEAGVFWHNHGLENIKHWERIAHKNIIDVGGFIGDSAIILQKYTDKKVYSFEAMSENYDLMLQTLKLNNAQRIVPIKKALGASFERIKIVKYGAGSSAVVIYNNTDFEEVEVMTLDSFVQEHNLEVGFIKVDIEGFEMPFLQGALHTIKTQKPAMLISIYHQASDFFDIKPFLEDLDLGYTFCVYKPIDGSVSGETCLFCEVRD
ncbi:FkbM family methyltransferase [Helicobacter sp. MIT 21-1697]|uniref:FkbM family methyltransferase n=1 Tax=Helicobacter sp. MIT 21-1697 TaxID=2993733 RepID=UPI00224B78EB|nr:FkbM family methyltransferase [Helicobacter sp. MIT 21-1697]MCX2716506.1 FkbM family methyltransferase [Helicobacter sp. MIT 21-1697]